MQLFTFHIWKRNASINIFDSLLFQEFLLKRNTAFFLFPGKYKAGPNK